MFGSCGVEVGFCSFGTDAEGYSCFFERGEAGVCCGVEFVAFALGVGPDQGDFLGCLSLGTVGALLCGGLGLLCPRSFLAGPASGVGDLTRCLLAGLVDVVPGGGPYLLKFGARLRAYLADLRGGALVQRGKFPREFVHAGDRLGGCVVRLLLSGAQDSDVGGF